MSIMVTVDWDFFVIEKPHWDMGHQESPLFLDVLWAHRYGLRNEMKTTGHEKDFWNIVGNLLPISENADIHVSDSHLYAYPAANDCEGIFLFDAHHDCWETRESGKVQCDNWLRIWLEENEERWAVWVYPEHARWQGAPELPEDMVGRIDVVTWKVFAEHPELVPGKETVDTLHICRSGCWTPPWLDQAFIDFFSEGCSPHDYHIQQDGIWNPMKLRWDEETESKAKSMLEKTNEMMAESAKKMMSSQK